MCKVKRRKPYGNARAARNPQELLRAGEALPVPQKVGSELVKRATALVLNAFNSRSARASLLFGKQYEAFWDGAYKAFGGKVDRAKTDSLRLAQACSSFYEGRWRPCRKSFPAMPQATRLGRARQTRCSKSQSGPPSGSSKSARTPMLQAGRRRARKAAHGFPASYKLVAQMPFGKIEVPASVKEGESFELRVEVFEQGLGVSAALRLPRERFWARGGRAPGVIGKLAA